MCYCNYTGLLFSLLAGYKRKHTVVWSCETKGSVSFRGVAGAFPSPLPRSVEIVLLKFIIDVDKCLTKYMSSDSVCNRRSYYVAVLITGTMDSAKKKKLHGHTWLSPAHVDLLKLSVNLQ